MLLQWQNVVKQVQKSLQKLQESHAVGEAFGYYFNEAGEVVHKVQTIGLQLDDLEHVEHVIAVAGGASKAKAIRAYYETSTIINDSHY